MRKIKLICFCLVGFISIDGYSLSLDSFLEQVSKDNQGYTASQKSYEAGTSRAEEGDLVLAYSFFTNYQFSNDKRESNFSFITGDRVTNNNLAFGFNKQTTFGFSGSLYYNISQTSMHGANTTLLNSSQYYETRPVLEFKQSLWQNAFGRQTRAIIEATDAKNLSSSYSASYNSKKILSDAEAVYWKLSLMREMVKIKQDNLGRATKIKDWSEKRTKLNLADKADFLQADANFKMAQLELQAALDDERDLIRQLNTMRGINSDELSEELEILTVDSVEAMNMPERKGVRDDVASFREMAKAASANAILSKDKNKPTLELFSTLSLNGRDPSFDPSFKESWGGNYPYTVVGLRFNAPLDFGNIKRVNSGYELEKLSAQDSYDRKRFEVDREWDSLTKKVQELKERLKIAKQVEDAQLIKYTHEQGRHNLGRTTTYQVIMFEQDYATAQYLRMNLQSQVLQLLATMKTFEGKEEKSI